jgi:SAM-dependent methyltransferase
MSYLMGGRQSELERLRLQVRVWEPEVEAFFDRVGVERGWRCVDLGCGALGVLGPLSRRVGPTGHVVGVENDAIQVAGARAAIAEEGWTNVELAEDDAYRTRLPRASFDLVHVRFLFAPGGRDAELLKEMLALARPGGVVAVQEPDTSSWSCQPPHAAWDRLTDTVRAAFRLGGGDLDAGRRTFGLLRAAGVEDLRLRAAVVGLKDRNPYLRLPAMFATSLRPRILEGGLLTAADLDELIAAVEAIADDPARTGLSYVVTQVWGRTPR